MQKNAVGVVALIVGIIGVILGGVGLGLALTATSSPQMETTVFTHAEISADEITLVSSDPSTSNVGDVRYYDIPGTSPDGGLLTGSLTTVAVNAPASGQEIRESSLLFSFGDVTDQMTVGGEAIYETASPALKVGDVIVRPILGGAGKFAGATGWVETTHLEDGTWRHEFHYSLVK